jgi:hypothetical protein
VKVANPRSRRVLSAAVTACGSPARSRLSTWIRSRRRNAAAGADRPLTIAGGRAEARRRDGRDHGAAADGAHEAVGLDLLARARQPRQVHEHQVLERLAQRDEVDQSPSPCR